MKGGVNKGLLKRPRDIVLEYEMAHISFSARRVFFSQKWLFYGRDGQRGVHGVEATPKTNLDSTRIPQSPAATYWVKRNNKIALGFFFLLLKEQWGLHWVVKISQYKQNIWNWKWTSSHFIMWDLLLFWFIFCYLGYERGRCLKIWPIYVVTPTFMTCQISVTLWPFYYF